MGHVCVVEQVQQVAGAQEEAIILAQALLDRERLGAEESERLHKSKVSFFLPVSRFLQLTARSARVVVCGRVRTFLCVCVSVCVLKRLWERCSSQMHRWSVSIPATHVHSSSLTARNS